MFERDTKEMNEFYEDHPHCVRVVYGDKIIVYGFNARYDALARANYILEFDKKAKSIIVVDYASGYKILK